MVQRVLRTPIKAAVQYSGALNETICCSRCLNQELPMSSEDQKRKANQLKLIVSLILVAIFGVVVIIGQRMFLAKVEESGKPKFQGKLERSRTPVTLPTETEDIQPKTVPPVRLANVVQRTNTPSKQPQVETESDTVKNSGGTELPIAQQKTETASNLVPVSSANAALGGTIRGRVTLAGTPPDERPIDALIKDPLCSKHLTNKPTTRFYVVGENNGLGDAFVYIKEGLQRVRLGRLLQPPKEAVLLDQVGCEYSPYVLGLQMGQTLLVRNSDPVLHNVHPTPLAVGNKESNRAQMAGARDLAFVFEKPELFLRFKCDVHPWMFAYVCVVNHPYFAVTKPDGTFSIEGLPKGNYVVEAVHRKAGRATRQVDLSRRTAEANFELAVGPQ
jgi:hypothetical protein